jgi:hypothetical protein
MIHVQIIAHNDRNLQSLIRNAIVDGKIKSFETAKVKGGLKITHKKHIGSVNLTRTSGPLIALVKCNNRDKEWQLLEAFIGRLAYHFKSDIAAINIQFAPTADR